MQAAELLHFSHCPPHNGICLRTPFYTLVIIYCLSLCVLKMDYINARERMRELKEEIDDLDKMEKIQSLSLKEVLSEIDTPANSDSEEDEVRLGVPWYVVFN